MRASYYGVNDEHGSIETVYTPSNVIGTIGNVSQLYNSDVGKGNVVCKQDHYFDEYAEVFLGRLDTKKVLKTTVFKDSDIFFYSETMFFEPSDFRYTIKIWLATTPPPWWDDLGPSGGVDVSG